MALVRSGAAARIAVSLGPDGAFLATSAGITHMPAIQTKVLSAVGAGDSFLAGMTLSLSRGESDRDALAWGIAVAATAVASLGTARVTPDVAMAYWRDLTHPAL